MKYGFILFMAIVFGISSCYEDKGNYTYKNLKQIQIGNLVSGRSISLTMGDTLRVNPVFTYSTPDTVMNLKYSWTLRGKVIGNERNLEYIVNDTVNANCFFSVEDIDNGVLFVSDFALRVGYKYQKEGFLVLSEKDGRSMLSFLPQTYNRTNTAGEIDSLNFNVVEDIYKKESGEELNGKPVLVHEHFCTDKQTQGQTLVVLENGLVDVNSLTFRKEVTGDQMFPGGWPSGLKPANVMFMQWVDLIQDQKGRLYSRVKSTSALFHSEYFLPEPLTYENQVMENMNIILGKFRDSKLCLLYDGNRNRYLAYMDFKDRNEISSVGEIKPLTVDNTTNGYPQNFIPLENFGEYKLRYTGYWMDPYWFTGLIGYFSLLEKGGKYYHQEFVIEKDYYTTDLILQDMSCQEIPGLENYISENSVIYALPYINYGKYVLIATGKNLYLYDREVPKNGVKLFYTFDGNVTSMDAEDYASACLGVALDNGKLVVLKMIGAKNLQTDKEKFFWETPADINLGDIKSIRYKVQGGNGWS